MVIDQTPKLMRRSKLPIVKQIESSGMEYILVAKPADHQNIEENLTGIRKIGGVEHLKFKNDDEKRF